MVFFIFCKTFEATKGRKLFVCDFFEMRSLKLVRSGSDGMFSLQYSKCFEESKLFESFELSENLSNSSEPRIDDWSFLRMFSLFEQRDDKDPELSDSLLEK